MMMPTVHQAQEKNITGKTFFNVKVKNAQNDDVMIPGIGSKVVIVFYTDPDCKDVNDPMSAAIKDGGFKDKIAGIGVVNCTDTWIPDVLIRQGALKKEKQFQGSVILLDPKHILKKSCDLGNCNNASIVIIIGRDNKVKYSRTIKSEKESIEAIPEVIEVIGRELN